MDRVTAIHETPEDIEEKRERLIEAVTVLREQTLPEALKRYLEKYHIKGYGNLIATETELEYGGDEEILALTLEQVRLKAMFLSFDEANPESQEIHERLLAIFLRQSAEAQADLLRCLDLFETLLDPRPNARYVSENYLIDELVRSIYKTYYQDEEFNEVLDSINVNNLVKKFFDIPVKYRREQCGKFLTRIFELLETYPEFVLKNIEHSSYLDRKAKEKFTGFKDENQPEMVLSGDEEELQRRLAALLICKFN